MSGFSGTELSTFESAYKLLIRTARRSVNTINNYPVDLAKFCQTLSEALENKERRIHVIGEGRSGKIGIILGECLKNIGFAGRVSYLGKSFAQPIKENDVVIVVTSSGWTKLTTAVMENSIWEKAKILTFTGALDSKAAKLSDVVIQSPLGFQPQDQTFPFASKQAPLSPLGTVFELTTMVIGIGIINGVFTGSCTNGFNEGTNTILTAAERTLDDLKKSSTISNLIKTLSDSCYQKKSRIFLHGNGISDIICKMSAERFQSLNMNVRSINDWRFRRNGDLLIALSGSGSSTETVNLVENAKTSQMTVFGLTSFPQSELAKRSDDFLVLSGRKDKKKPDDLQIMQHEIFIPTFEYIAATILEACVAQIAFDLGITENIV